MLASILCGFGVSNGKVDNIIRKYGIETFEKKLRINGINPESHETFSPKITSLEIKSIKTREVGDMTLHFVKARVVFDYNPKTNGIIHKEKLYRWMALVIEEDGFGKMLVNPAKSKEVMTLSIDGESAKKLFPDSFIAGENLIK
jgi:hypothetical protein